MENETVSKNFIENIIDKDLAEGVYDTVHTRFPTGAERIPPYRTCQMYPFKLRACPGIQWQVQYAF